MLGFCRPAICRRSFPKRNHQFFADHPDRQLRHLPCFQRLDFIDMTSIPRHEIDIANSVADRGYTGSASCCRPDSTCIPCICGFPCRQISHGKSMHRPEATMRAFMHRPEENARRRCMREHASRPGIAVVPGKGRTSDRHGQPSVNGYEWRIRSIMLHRGWIGDTQYHGPCVVQTTASVVPGSGCSSRCQHGADFNRSPARREFPC